MTTPSPSSPGDDPVAVPETEPAHPPILPITHDLPCMQCGYNLRTRTAADRCPECGTPISQTFAHLRQAADILVDDRAYRASTLIFGGISIVAVPVYASQAILESSLAGRLPAVLFTFINPIAMTLVHIFFLFAVTFGLLLFCAGFSQRILSPGARSLASLITMLYAALSVPFALGSTGRMIRFRFARFAPFRAGMAIVQYRLSVALLSLFLLGVGILCFRRLGATLASDPLKRTARWVFLVMIAQAIFPIAIFVLLGTYNVRRGWLLPEPRVLIAPDILSAVASAIFAWFWLSPARSIFRRRSVATSSRDARPPPAPTTQKVAEFFKRRT